MGSTISIPRDRQNKIATGIVSGEIFSSLHFFAIKSFDSFSISPTSRFISIQILGILANLDVLFNLAVVTNPGVPADLGVRTNLDKRARLFKSFLSNTK